MSSKDNDRENMDSQSPDTKEIKTLRPPSKVVIRRLPPYLTEAEFLEEVGALPEYDYLKYLNADHSLTPYASCRVYINFVDNNAIIGFANTWDGYLFVDGKGNESQAVVEFAPYQRIPRLQRKTDARCGTILDDREYKSFLDNLNASNESNVQISSIQEEFLREVKSREEELKMNKGFLRKTTPLLDYIKDKKEAARKREAERREIKKKRDDERRKFRDDDRKREERLRRLQEKEESLKFKDNVLEDDEIYPNNYVSEDIDTKKQYINSSVVRYGQSASSLEFKDDFKYEDDHSKRRDREAPRRRGRRSPRPYIGADDYKDGKGDRGQTYTEEEAITKSKSNRDPARIMSRRLDKGARKDVDDVRSSRESESRYSYGESAKMLDVGYRKSVSYSKQKTVSKSGGDGKLDSGKSDRPREILKSDKLNVESSCGVDSSIGTERTRDEVKASRSSDAPGKKIRPERDIYRPGQSRLRGTRGLRDSKETKE